MPKSGFIPCVSLGILLAACANGQDAAEQEPRQAHKPAPPETGELRVQPATGNARDVGPGAAAGAANLGPGLQRLADFAKQDLAAKLGADTADIEAVQGEYVTWQDASLGCPQPGFQYMQVLTNGSRIRLSDGKQVYQYHSGGNRQPFHCENPSPTEPLPYPPGEM